MSAATTIRPAVTAQVEIVTPAVAEKWLGLNDNNRPVRAGRVSTLARDMTAGHWQVTGEGIKFSVSGRLIDGQHRLKAVVESGVSVPMMVVRGVDESAQDVMDSGAARTAADQLGIAGHRNPSLLASAARWLVLYESGRLYDKSSATTTHSEVKAVVDGNHLLADAVDLAASIRRLIDCPPSVLGAAAYLCMGRDRAAATEFFSRLADGVNLDHGSPILALRNRQRIILTDRIRVDGKTHLALIVRAWNAWREGRAMTALPAFSKGVPVTCPEPK